MENEYLKNLHLKELLTGRISGPLTNLPSNDRPWLKHFSDEEILREIPSCTMYEDLINSNKSNLNSIALEFYGTKITYQELLDNIEQTASSLVSLGVRKGDTVVVSMPYLPETIYLIYAINKIGAVVNMIDPRINKELMTHYINKANSKYAFIVGKIDEKIKDILPKTTLTKVVSIPATNSVKNKLLKLPSKVSKKYFMEWNDFFKKGLERVDTKHSTEDSLAIIEYTSGTSGIPKGVKLSNKSLVSLSHSSRISYKCSVGDKFLLIMPPFIAYGLAIGMHDMLCMGQHLLIIPNFSLDKAKTVLPKLLDKYKPNYIMGVPNFLLFLLDYKKDTSYIKGIVIGGDHLEESLEKKVKDKFPNLNILKGWGMTEIASCGIFTKTDINNPLGSVGIPLLNNNIKILPINEFSEYDIDGKEISYNEDGLLFINSPTSSTGYFENEEETKKIIVIDKNGNKWINTGDVFSIDENGYLYFKKRIKRIVVRPDGHNIPSTQIEKIGLKNDEVLKSIVVGIPSKKYSHGRHAVLCIQTNNPNMPYDEIETLLKKISADCVQELQPRDRPKYIVAIDEISLTPNGKVDFSNLEKRIRELLDNIEYDEDSNEISYIIEKNKEKVKVRTRNIFKKKIRN